MPKIKIPYQKTGYFTKTMCDYLSQDTTLSDFYGNFPTLENFKNQINLKKVSFSSEMRQVLNKQLNVQYSTTKTSKTTLENINSLLAKTTFTVTTGHQLNLFTGPLYFLYKIFSVINLSEELKKAYPENHFVPIYWMATEDHDFDEINYFNFKDKKIAWNREDGGAVGELSTEGLDKVLEILIKEFGQSENGKKLSQLFEEAYINHKTLTEATRYLGNELFKEYGLVIVDGNDAQLKKAFIPYAEKELAENLSFKKVTETTNRLIAAGYGEQVYPREINLFYLKEGLRERIVEFEGEFQIVDTDIKFSKDQIFNELQNYPERFSPNALLRPLYQEVILPNLCYTGGGGELAYWFQLKDYFKSVDVPFPVLLLRNSALLIPSKVSEKLQKMDVKIVELFKKQHQLQTDFTKKISKIKIDFTTQREHLKQQFESMYDVAEKTDASFRGAVEAQETKQLKGLDNLEKRLLKAQKRKLVDQLGRLTALQDELFPKQSLQERNTNFSQFYLEYGGSLLNTLKDDLKPLALEFSVFEL
ncbi:putative cysteine ligase BshC [Patiriisocius marinistellae]|uniref:Putative cysteine ligase BshC n=1 Tax=Patiriisocius marinistellae TaxID=2494560 RepID=A0A5J4G2A6_9FLAO|nr:bacillithiol biosynthesis cysteine-adding enzyme BshC [Patiriisocius marinistellae]GEQ86705.1 putative cysteine ligase BshC [Patiriisocius marinistellae]